MTISRALPVDLDGWPYEVFDWGSYRMSKCCHAAVSYYDSDLCCKACYNESSF